MLVSTRCRDSIVSKPLRFNSACNLKSQAGTAFSISPTGTFEFGSLAATSLIAGATNLLTISGLNTGDGAYSGTLTFASQSAVPEPATWALMLIGFGAVGFSVRRRRPHLAQAV